MRRLFWGVFVALLIAVLAYMTLWGSLAMWFRLPFPNTIKISASTLYGVFGLAVIILQFTQKRWKALAAFGVVFAIVMIWWHSLEPPVDREWAADMAHQTTGTFDGNTVTLNNIRDFKWVSDTEFTENWITRQYDLSQIETVDLFLSYWGNPYMAHFVLSFGFSNGEHIAWSVEVRRTVEGEWSPVADFFKEHTLLILAATEEDVVGVRSNIRKEDVHLFRLKVSQQGARILFEEYVREANALAERPAWYNSITTNCTTVIYKMLRQVGGAERFNWRLIVNGYLPELLHKNNRVNTSYSVEELRERGDISKQAIEAGLGDGYSESIRVGVPLAE